MTISSIQNRPPLVAVKQGLNMADVPKDYVSPPVKHGVSTKNYFAQRIEQSSQMLATFQNMNEAQPRSEFATNIAQLQDAIDRYKTAMAKAPDGPGLYLIID